MGSTMDSQTAHGFAKGSLGRGCVDLVDGLVKGYRWALQMLRIKLIKLWIFPESPNDIK